MKRRDPYFKLSGDIKYLANDVAGLFERLNKLSASLAAFKIEYAENWDLFNNSESVTPPLVVAESKKSDPD
jgi:hypothetical protein